MILTELETMDNYIEAVKDMIDEPEPDWEKVMIYLECMEDELEDAKAAVWDRTDWDDEEEV